MGKRKISSSAEITRASDASAGTSEIDTAATPDSNLPAKRAKIEDNSESAEEKVWRKKYGHLSLEEARGMLNLLHIHDLIVSQISKPRNGVKTRASMRIL